MQTAPSNWAALFAAEHKTEYKYTINGVDYFSNSIQGTPVIVKPLLDKPAIGRVCSATASLTLWPVNVTIPKAARVLVYCRLTSADGSTVTDWMPQGRFYVTSRRTRSNLILNLRDDMVKAGQTYLDKSQYNDWPQQQADVAADIASIMGVEIDSRTVLATGAAYQVNNLSTDTLMSEVLASIAVSNGGNWIMTEAGKLRLVPLTSPKTSATADADIGRAYKSFDKTGVPATITRVTLTDSSTGDVYTAGDNTGYELTCTHDNGNQAVTNAIWSALTGVTYTPYELQKAMLNPLLELGDTVKLTQKDGTTTTVLLGSINVTCNVAYVCDAALAAEQDAEEEYPYQSVSELREKRTVRTNQSYYGATLNKGDGLIIRRIRNGAEEAKVTFNADQMAFYQGNTQVLFFDPVQRIWKMSAAVEIDVDDGDGNISTLSALAQGFKSDVTDLQEGYSTLDQTAKGLALDIQDVNGKYVTIKATVDGFTVTDQSGTTLINGGSIKTDNLYLSHLFSPNGLTSYIQMLDNGLNFVLGSSETIGIGYYSASHPQPYMIFGAGATPNSSTPGMIKKYSNGIWIGDSADRDKDSITNGTGLFINTNTRVIYKYNNGIGVALADTSNVTAVFG